MRFALESQNPLVTAPVIGITNSPYPATHHSLLTISNPNVLLWALKPHDDGIEHGFVVRAWNQASQPSVARFAAAAPLQSAQGITHIETPLDPLPLIDGVLETSIPARRIECYRLKLRQ